MPSTDFPPSPDTASGAVFAGIVHGLETRAFLPGQRLVEAELAEQFGVGRNSVREALQKLAADGIVELNRHRGAAIRTLTLADAQDVLEIAEYMTGLLAARAARRAKTSEHAPALRAALAELDGAADRQAFLAARRHFYRALLDIAANSELKRLFPAIQMHVVHACFRVAGLRDLRLADYRRIGAAVLAGRVDAARQAGADHVQRVRRAIEDLAGD
ncbi:GntR family transcriptional regulator [Bordetella genomosp. 13]|uniref:GntR family transcriptional regulator n=1 Tax=Bordetella genomosp. 13 TaxID=463040 RepID=UPI00391F7FA2